jgi:glycosyltransferase involved in cell wall biosynthesis
MKLSVVIPLYNEEKNISANVDEIVSALKELSGNYEIIIVNDGSTDNSLSVLKTIVKKYPFVKVVSYEKNRGRGYALRQGYSRANGEYIVATESDLNWGADIILRLLNELESTKADIVIASPYRKGGSLVNVPFKRAFLSKVGNIILSAAVKNKLTMVSGMTRGYRRDAIKNMILENDDKEIHLEIISKALALGYKIVEIPAVLKWKDEDRKNTTKRKSTFNPKKFIKTHLIFAFTQRPGLMLFFSMMLSVFFAIAYLLFCLIFSIPLNLANLAVFFILLLMINFVMQLFQIRILGEHSKSNLKKLALLYKPYLELEGAKKKNEK